MERNRRMFSLFASTMVPIASNAAATASTKGAGEDARVATVDRRGEIHKLQTHTT